MGRRTLFLVLLLTQPPGCSDGHDSPPPDPPTAWARPVASVEKDPAPAASPPIAWEALDCAGPPPPATCGPCGVWRCTARGAECETRAPNACGGCRDLPAAGEVCGGCGAVACTGPDSVMCAGGPCADLVEVAAVTIPAETSPNQYGSGLAFGDLDGDGAVDVVIGAPDAPRVLRGDGAGSFSDWPEALGASPAPPRVASVTLADWDGDEDLDLFLTAQSPEPGLFLFANDGSGLFADASAGLGFPLLPSPAGASWADYDGDGWLDVFVAGQFGSALLHNEGGTSFSDVAPALALDGPDRVAFQSVWLDYDLDRDVDLLVAHDRGPPFGDTTMLHRNDGGGTFTDVSAAAGFVDLIWGMGIAAADFDDDGDLDVLVTNIGWSPLPGTGQKLYVNLGDGTFAEGAHDAGAGADDRFAWGALFLDRDDDGDLDLALAALTGSVLVPGGPWLGEAWGGGGAFLDVSGVVTELPYTNAFGVAAADFDGDGRLDLGWAIQEDGLAGRFYRNVAAPRHWLRVKLSAPPPNVHGIGGMVFVEAGGVRRLRTIDAGGSFLSASEAVAHFGLGDTATVDEIEVWFPDGSTAVLAGPIAADQLVTVTP